MKNIKKILLAIMNIAIPIVLYYIIIFYLFFTQGSGSSGDKYIESYGIYWNIIYSCIGVLHLLLLYKFFKVQHNFKNILIVIILILYCYINYINW
jgi:hypothetical protein